MALEIEITNEANCVVIDLINTKAEDRITLPKNDVMIKCIGDCVNLYYNGLITQVNYTTVTVPAGSTSAKNLEETLRGYFYS